MHIISVYIRRRVQVWGRILGWVVLAVLVWVNPPPGAAQESVIVTLGSATVESGDRVLDVMSYAGPNGENAFGNSAISNAAYPLLADLTAANQTNFYVYQDADSGFNHGFPSGFFGTVGKIHLDVACVDDPTLANGCSTDPNRLDRERGTVLRSSFDPLLPGEFAGLNIEEPENWGANHRGVGYDLRGATHVVFEVRSPTPGGVNVQFGVGGGTSAFVHIPQSSTYTPMSILLNSLAPSPPNLADVHILFAVATDSVNAPNGGTVLLDNIRFEPVPTSQLDTLGFPLANQTFGLVPLQSAAQDRVPIPQDQLLRNVTTIYESALTLLALLERGTNEDLSNARLIADTFLYALENDNQGNRLPVAPDGSVGLHRAYESGDIALFNDQAPGAGRKGDVRLAGFTASKELCPPAGFCLVLDGATGGENAFAILALASAYRQFNDLRYLEGARTIGRWIVGNLTDNTGTGYGGYYLGYPDEGKIPKFLLTPKSIENNADIFAAFTVLADIERQLGNTTEADEWTRRANVAGDFVMEMFNPNTGCFYAGTEPVGTVPNSGVDPTGPQRGNDVINVFDFLDANTFTTLALAAAPRYRDRIDWRRPVQCVLDKFVQSITVGGQEFHGFNLVENPTAGPNGIAWEFTGQAVVTMQFVDRLYQESRFEGNSDFYLDQIRQAQSLAPFSDGRGLVASTLQDGNLLPPIEQCLSTPFQCIAERVGLAATTWAIFADREFNPLAAPIEPGSITIVKVVNGQPSDSDWQFSGSLGNFILPAGGGQQTFSSLAPGNYTINETTQPNYAASVSCNTGESGISSVTVNLAAGESVTCTFTNTFVPPVPTTTTGGLIGLIVALGLTLLAGILGLNRIAVASNRP